MEAHYMCWDGPCEGVLVTDCPMDAEVGDACAVRWKTPEGTNRFAVYVLLEKPSGERGLVYERHSYDKPWKAQQRVEQLMAAVTAHRKHVARS